MSAPTKSTMSPWMITVRGVASSGGKISGSRLRVDVPVCRAAKSSAERPMPTAVLRPRRATAMPMKPIVEVKSVVSSPELPAQDVEGPGEPGEAPGDRHGENVVARDADPPVPRGLRIVQRPAPRTRASSVQEQGVDDEGEANATPRLIHGSPWSSWMAPDSACVIFPSPRSCSRGISGGWSFCRGLRSRTGRSRPR